MNEIARSHMPLCLMSQTLAHDGLPLEIERTQPRYAAWCRASRDARGRFLELVESGELTNAELLVEARADGGILLQVLEVLRPGSTAQTEQMPPDEA